MIGGKSFDMCLAKIRAEVEHCIDPDVVEQGLKADKLLVAASQVRSAVMQTIPLLAFQFYPLVCCHMVYMHAKMQVGACECEREKAFETARFLRELRIFFLDIVIMRTFLYLNLPLLQVVPTSDGSCPRLPPAPFDKTAHLSTTAGQIRMAEWFSGILQESDSSQKTAIRRYAYCCSTSCKTNQAMLPLRVQVPFLCPTQATM